MFNLDLLFFLIAHSFRYYSCSSDRQTSECFLLLVTVSLLYPSDTTPAPPIGEHQSASSSCCDNNCVKPTHQNPKSRQLLYHTTMGNAQATDKNQPPATIKEQRKDVETNEAEPSLNTPIKKDKNSRGPWFVAHEDYHTGKATLVPKHASKHNIEQDEQLHKVGYIFTRLYCNHDTKHAQPHVNKHLLPHRFDSLRKQTLTHLLSDTVLIPNLRQFDSSMQETEQLQRAMRQQTESLRAAFKNPKVNLS